MVLAETTFFTSSFHLESSRLFSCNILSLNCLSILAKNKTPISAMKSRARQRLHNLHANKAEKEKWKETTSQTWWPRPTNASENDLWIWLILGLGLELKDIYLQNHYQSLIFCLFNIIDAHQTKEKKSFQPKRYLYLPGPVVKGIRYDNDPINFFIFLFVMNQKNK